MSVVAGWLDKLTAAILDGYVNTANKGDHEEAQEKVKSFLLANIGRLEHWVKIHPGRRPPVVFNHQTGEVIWLRREQKRKMERRLAKAARRARGL